MADLPCIVSGRVAKLVYAWVLRTQVGNDVRVRIPPRPPPVRDGVRRGESGHIFWQGGPPEGGPLESHPRHHSGRGAVASALALGARGRQFESGRPDQVIPRL
jgi:hypothetical protein